jgi:hypothetical protein
MLSTLFSSALLSINTTLVIPGKQLCKSHIMRILRIIEIILTTKINFIIVIIIEIDGELTPTIFVLDISNQPMQLENQYG